MIFEKIIPWDNTLGREWDPYLGVEAPKFLVRVSKPEVDIGRIEGPQCKTVMFVAAQVGVGLRQGIR